MNKELITQPDKYFKFTKTSLIIDKKTPIEDWISCGKWIKSAEGAVQWWLADWINFGEKAYGEMYSQALEATDYSYGGLRNISYVGKRFEMSRRRDNVDFSFYQELASLSETDQEKWLNRIEEKKLSFRELRTGVKRSKILLPKLEGNSKATIKCGDFRNLIKEVPKNSIDLVITDPPYPEEYLPLWTDLAEQAKRVLKPGGFLVSYSGQSFLPEVIDKLNKSLKYYWLMGLYHKGASGQRFGVNMWNRFKPILVYYKEPLIKQDNWIEDIVVSEQPDKDKHEWGQSVEPFVKLIETFSKEGETILDPFFGGGATIEAAVNTKRHIIGYEINREYFNLVKKRLK